jgi:hypothetical protein
VIPRRSDDEKNLRESQSKNNLRNDRETSEVNVFSNGNILRYEKKSKGCNQQEWAISRLGKYPFSERDISYRQKRRTGKAEERMETSPARVILFMQMRKLVKQTFL